MKGFLDSVVSNPIGAYVVLAFAALLEVTGDACFQSGMYKSTGVERVVWLVGGTAVLAFYGFFVNLPPWDFGKLLGVYVVLFFVMAQIVARVRFGQTPTPSILLGGAFIVTGGLVMTFWKG